jgi:hypothetical protein
LKHDLTLEKYFNPFQCYKLLQKGILKNPLIAKCLPEKTLECVAKITYVGSDFPSIPIKGLEACNLNVLLKRKCGVESEQQETAMNT